MDEHVPLALEILSVHPVLKDVRFKLVPSKMPEEKFWAALFGILNDGAVDIDELIGDLTTDAVHDDYDTGDEVELNISVSSPSSAKAAQSPNRDFQADASYTPFSYLEEIEAQNELISRLQKSLREANHKIRKLGIEVHKERQKRHSEGITNGNDTMGKTHTGEHPSSCPRCNSKLGIESTSQHSGKWEMHKDCEEFLKLDDHLKENLRNEKEKRINEVLSQMKFILDSDEMKDTYGKWSCCGKEEYEAKGCTE